MPLFMDGIPHEERAPPFKLKDVNKEKIIKVAERYEVAHARVDDFYKGERTVFQVMFVAAADLSRLKPFKRTLRRGMAYQSPAMECRNQDNVRNQVIRG